MNDFGFFLLNKPENLTSSDLVQRIKKITKVAKIGHTGTLDKFACGLMILPFGAYTSFASYFLTENKTYIAKVKLGRFTDSGDRDGKVLKEVSEREVEIWFSQNQNLLIQELQNLTHLKEQVPPKISALKVKGKRQSDLYRSNIEFETYSRPIQIYYVKILEISNMSFTFEVKVSSGTYIRKLVMDISEKLDFPMYLENLRRTQIGKLHIKDANTFEDFEKGNYKAYSVLEVLDIPNILVSGEQEKKILHGNKIFISDPPQEFLLMNSNQKVLAWCKRAGKDYKFQKVFQ